MIDPLQVILAPPRPASARTKSRPCDLLIESSSQSHEQLRLMVESIGDYAIVMLTPEGRVASWNVGAERILGYPGRGNTGTEPCRVLPPRGRSPPGSRAPHRDVQDRRDIRGRGLASTEGSIPGSGPMLACPRCGAPRVVSSDSRPSFETSPRRGEPSSRFARHTTSWKLESEIEPRNSPLPTMRCRQRWLERIQAEAVLQQQSLRLAVDPGQHRGCRDRRRG